MSDETNNIEEKKDEDLTPISMWGYFWYEVLYAIPVVGWIFLIVNSFAGNNRNKKNFARSHFCFLIIGAVIAIIVALIAAATGAGHSSGYYF